MKISTVGIVAAFAAAAGMAQASVYVNSQFGTFANGNLVGQGGWSQLAAATANPLQVSSGAVRIAGGQSIDGQDAVNAFTGPLSGGDSIYLASRFTVNAVQPVGNTSTYFLALREASASGFANVRVAVRAGTDPSTYQIGIRLTGQASNPFQYSGNLPLGTSIDLIVAYDAFAGGTSNDQIFGFINPVSADRDFNLFFASQTNAANNDVTGFSGAIISQFGSSSASTADVTLSSVVVATSFEEAYSSIPSPGALALIGLGGLVATRRRR